MSIRPQSSDQLTVQTIDAKGVAPKRRIATAQAGLTAYQQLREIERRRDLRFDAIAGIFAGFPPTPPAQMEEMGMGDFPNINCKQFEAKINAYVDNWNAINAAGSDWFEVEAEHDNPMEAMRRSKVISKHFNCAIKQWDNTDYAIGRHYIVKSATRDKQMGLFGIGVAHFCDAIDFRWRVRPTRKVLVPEGTDLLLDNCPFLCIEDEMSVPDLWAMRDKPGWNKEAIEKLLYLNTFRTSSQTNNAETLAEWTERIRENDTWTYSDFPLVKFVHLYVKEFTSTANKADITHCILSDAVPALSSIPDSEATRRGIDKSMSWLYESDKSVASRWNQVVCVFSDNTGAEGKWHGVKGFGDLIFDSCHFNNLFFNRAAGAAIVSGMLLFKGGTEADRQKMNQIKVTPFGAMIDMEIEQFQLKPDTQSSVSMFQLSTSILDTNSRQVPVNQETSRGEAPTATQTNFDRADEAQFTNLQVSNYRSTGLDCLGGEQYRRIAQPGSKYPESWPGGDVAKQFREKCEKDGIPEADLLKIKFVRGNRNTGSGNMGLDLMKGDKLLQVSTPGEGQKNAQRFIASALVGPDMVKAFVVDEVPPPNFEDVTINQENMCIQGGQTPQAFGEQPHEKHLMGGATQGHLPMLGEIQQVATQMMEAGLEQNVEAADKLLRSLLAGIEHSGQHVAFMGEYRRSGKGKALFEEQVKELQKVLNDLQQFAETLGEALEQAQQAANPQAGMDPKMVETQAKIQRDDMVAEAKIERDNQTTMAKLEQKEVANALKVEQAAANHETKLAQTAQQKEFDQVAAAAKTEQELQTQAVKDAMEVGKTAVLSRIEVEKAKEKPAPTSDK